MITRSLADRDNLTEEQLASISCPVLALHGTEDQVRLSLPPLLHPTHAKRHTSQVYSVPLMEEWFALLSGSSHAQKLVVEGGSHFLAASHPKETNEALLKWYQEL